MSSIYKPEETALKRTVAKFFFDTEEKRPIPYVRDSEDELLRGLLAELGKLDVMLAGGAITSLFTGNNVNDLDIYMRDRKRLPELVTLMTATFGEPVFTSENSITFKRKSSRSRKMWCVQVITRFDGQPQDIFNNFDFTVVTGAYTFSDNQFHFGDRFFQDLGARKLVYLGASKYPICALWRTKKYQARGYSVPGSTIMHIALSIVRLEINTYKQLKEQLLGIDTMYLQDLLGSSKYDADLPVDYGQFLEDALNYLNVYQPDEHDND